MRKDLIHIVCCPADKARLDLEGAEMDEHGDVVSGTLRCTECGFGYPVEDGIPNLLPPAYHVGSVGAKAKAVKDAGGREARAPNAGSGPSARAANVASEPGAQAGKDGGAKTESGRAPGKATKTPVTGAAKAPEAGEPATAEEE